MEKKLRPRQLEEWERKLVEAFESKAKELYATNAKWNNRDRTIEFEKIFIEQNQPLNNSGMLGGIIPVGTDFVDGYFGTSRIAFSCELEKSITPFDLEIEDDHKAYLESFQELVNTDAKNIVRIFEIGANDGRKQNQNSNKLNSMIDIISSCKSGKKYLLIGVRKDPLAGTEFLEINASEN